LSFNKKTFARRTNLQFLRQWVLHKRNLTAHFTAPSEVAQSQEQMRAGQNLEPFLCCPSKPTK